MIDQNLPPKFELKPGDCLQLLTQLYGYCESGNYWHKTLYNHHRNWLWMNQFSTNFVFYFIMNRNHLWGMSGIYVNDTMRAVTFPVYNLFSKTHNCFDIFSGGTLSCTFLGYWVWNTANGLVLSQKKYIKKMKPLPHDVLFSDLCFRQTKLA